jgi:glutaredoxin
MTEVWTLPDCPDCEEVKAELRFAGIPFAERSLIKLRKGEILDVNRRIWRTPSRLNWLN